MPADPASAVLHITAAAGGGVDRYIRDLAASTPRRHFVLHVGPRVDVLEDVRARTFTPLRADARSDQGSQTFASWLAAASVGAAHLHSLDRETCSRIPLLARNAHALPLLVTLHDLQFVDPLAFDAAGMPSPNVEWIRELTPVVRDATTVIAPSEFIGGIARTLYPGVDVAVIPPGIRVHATTESPPAPDDFAAHAPRHVVAVVGALGRHKGSGVLEPLVRALAGSDIGIVVIGYTDAILTRGWKVPGHFYLHGPYGDDSLAGWLAAYRAETVLFPNRLPESFSYTLSEVWSEGLPVIVPDEGALGERVAQHGGGWLLRAGFDGNVAAALIRRLQSPEGAAEHARVKSRIEPGDALRIPTLEAMARDVEALYARFSLPGSAADADAARAALAPLLAANLDGFVFRKELVDCAFEMERSKARLDEALAWNAKLQGDCDALRRDHEGWTQKLERDIAELKDEIERLREQNRRIADMLAFLPEVVRKFLLNRVLRARR